MILVGYYDKERERDWKTARFLMVIRRLYRSYGRHLKHTGRLLFREAGS
jgi:hypothetical protein